MYRSKALYAFIAVTFISSLFGLALADSGSDQEFFTQSSLTHNAKGEAVYARNAAGELILKQEASQESAEPKPTEYVDPAIKEITVKDSTSPAAAAPNPAAKPQAVKQALVQSPPAVPVQQAAAQNTALKSSPAAETPVQNNKDSIDMEQPVEVTELAKANIPAIEKPAEIYQLKKIDPNRIGAESSYVTFGGFKPVDYLMKNPSLGVGQRVEIYQEPKPVDAYMIMAKEMQHVWSDYHGWRQQSVQQTPANLRSLIVPLFVRAYGTEFTLSDPNASEHDIQGQIRYTMDYRDVYREYYPKFPDLKAERWYQQDVMLITVAKIKPLGWLYTSNVGYRFSNIDDKSYDTRWNFGTAPQVRSTYYANQSIAPNPRLEFFWQGEYYKSNFYHNDWAYTPDHYFMAGELRMKSKDMKTSYVGRLAYTKDIYSPFSNSFEKYEIFGRIGHDFNKKLNAYTMLKYVSDRTKSMDNAWWIAPPGKTLPVGAPFDVQALSLTSENRVQYMIYDKLWLQGGFDLGAGLNMCDYDNVGWLGGLEYYAPGIIRVDVGWRGNQYYNIDDFLSTIYFKCYFFM